MNMDELVPADTGEVVLLRFHYPTALLMESEVPAAVAYCVLKRPGTFLLALPAAYIPGPVLEKVFFQPLNPTPVPVLRPWSLQSQASGWAFTRAGAWKSSWPTSARSLWEAWRR